MSTICEKCGKELQVGEFPFCGGRNQHGFPLVGLKQLGDEIDEHLPDLAPDGSVVHFTSRSEKRRYLKEHGLMEFVRHQPLPGTDKSDKTSRWI